MFITEFMGSYNIGAFGFATDKYAILGPGFREKDVKVMENVLKVPVYTFTIDEEPLVGTYAKGNSFGLLLPHNVRDHEFKKFKEVFEDVEVEVLELRTYENALGNIILANDKGAIVNEDIYKRNRKSMQVIEDVLNVEVVPVNFSTPVIGSMVVVNNKGGLVSPLLGDEELNVIKDVLKLEKIGKGTGNMGSAIIGACYIVNSNGIIAGLKTTGLELQRAFEILL